MDEQHFDQPVCVDNITPDSIIVFKEGMSKAIEDIALVIKDKELSEDYFKKRGPIKWDKLREIIRREVSSKLREQWDAMWEEEGLTEKLTRLHHIKQAAGATSHARRPKTGDMGPQRRALDKKMLLAKIEALKKIKKEKEERVDCLNQKLAEECKQFKHIKENIHKHNQRVRTHRDKIKGKFQALELEFRTIEPLSDKIKEVHSTTLHQLCENRPWHENHLF